MKNIEKVLMGILLFSIFFIVEKFGFGFIYYLNVEVDIQFIDVILHMMIGDISVYLTHNTLVVFILEEMIKLIAFSVLTSYIFVCLINIQPNIVLPDKVVLREMPLDNLQLSILIGNKSKHNIYNVKCIITCYYIKENNKNQKNSEIEFSSEKGLIENYYRFSFDLTKLPRKMLSDFIDKNHNSFDQDSIHVAIIGNANNLGNSFRIEKNYKLSDIVIDEHEIKTEYKKERFRRKDKICKRGWVELFKNREVSEKRRQEVIEKIEKLIENMRE